MRRLIGVFSVWAMLAAGAASSVTAQDDRFADVEVEATHVAGKVWMLTGAGGNIGASVGEDGILIVDDQFAPLADKIRAALGKLGEGKVRLVLNTHWHGDHVGGNEVFGPEATIIAHDNVRARLATRQELSRGVTEPLPRHALPVVTFDGSLSVHLNGEEIRMIHFPHGHTDGDSVVFFTGSKVVHMGDNFWSGMFPFVDLEAGGDVEGLTRAVGQVLAELPEGAKVIPGHGTLSGPEDLRKYHDMLVRTTGIVRERKAAGQTLEQAVEAGLPEEWADWSGRFIDTARWVETVYRSLEGRKHHP